MVYKEKTSLDQFLKLHTAKDIFSLCDIIGNAQCDFLKTYVEKVTNLTVILCICTFGHRITVLMCFLFFPSI